MADLALLRRYGLFDAHVPRFTSYPPATSFSSAVGPAEFAKWIGAIPGSESVSLYVHIPFCRRLCWFCACRTQGTRTNGPLASYIGAVLDEARMIRRLLPGTIRIGRLHLGGGTPTILPTVMMAELLDGLDDLFDLSTLDEFSVEIDPTDVDDARLDVLFARGMTRASLGVQDFDPAVQGAIGRRQSFAETKETFGALRAGGITSINVDLLYGLPHQTRMSLAKTLDRVMEIGPDRLALYGYAHVPWASKRQVMIPTDALPSPEERLALFDQADARLRAEGYAPIGIDHFARPGDPLEVATRERRLARSFQGYTDDRSGALIGLGASAISRLRGGYAQNAASTSAYLSCIEEGRLATARGVALTERDRMLSQMIESLMCYRDIRLDDLGGRQIAAHDHIERLARAFPDAVRQTFQGLELRQSCHAMTRLIAGALAGAAADSDRFSAAI